LIFSTPVCGEVLLKFDANVNPSSQLMASVQAAHVNHTPLLIVSGTVTNGGSSWFQTLALAQSISDIYPSNFYHALGITADPGYRIDLTSISFDLAVNATDSNPAISQIYAFSSANNYAFNAPVAAGSALDLTVDLTVGATAHVSAPLSQSITSDPVTYRFYYVANENRVYWNNVTFEGTVTAVPEPAAGILAGVAGLVVWCSISRMKNARLPRLAR
jgi:hypothetical protein